jgi:hypothetical protein
VVHLEAAVATAHASKLRTCRVSCRVFGRAVSCVKEAYSSE